MYFDTHAHLNDFRYHKNLEQIINETRTKMVDRIVNIGYDVDSSKRAIKIANNYNGLYAAVGIHPNDVNKSEQSCLQEIDKLAKHPSVVAIGEIGLDFHYPDHNKDRQAIFFEKQIEIAKQNDLPIVVHSRDAQKETYDILAKHGKYRGIIHCYSGSYEMAEMLVKLGYYIGIGGTVTFKNAKKIKDIATRLPLENIVIETDCPYLTPEPYRGMINFPQYVHYVAEEIAKLKGISLEAVAQTTTNNGKKVYNIK